MSKIKFPYQNQKEVEITPAKFGIAIAKTMKEIGSSHVYFIMQQAYGEIGWSDCEAIWKIVLEEPKKRVKKTTLARNK